MNGDRAFRVRDGAAVGLSRGRMRGAAFVVPYWGIRATRDPETHAELALCFAPRLPPRAFFCGITAAALWGMPLPDGPLPELQVAVRHGDRRLEAAGIRAHHLALTPLDVKVHRSTRVTSIERTWRDLAAAGLSLAEIVAAGDYIRRHHPTETLAGAAGAAGARGARLLRSALPLLDGGSRSATESHMRVSIHIAGLPAPRINAALYGRSGLYLGRPDFAWPENRVLLEYEGDQHRTDRIQWQHDLARFSRFQEEGWMALRAPSADYRAPGRLLAQLSRVLAARS